MNNYYPKVAICCVCTVIGEIDEMLTFSMNQNGIKPATSHDATYNKHVCQRCATIISMNLATPNLVEFVLD